VLDESTGRKLNVTFTEEAAFWQWATVETLGRTGLRCEELLELSQLSIRQYARPNGDIVAVLVVVPSKTDRERVIPMTAELFMWSRPSSAASPGTGGACLWRPALTRTNASRVSRSRFFSSARSGNAPKSSMPERCAQNPPNSAMP
jgi:hypothetical protein